MFGLYICITCVKLESPSVICIWSGITTRDLLMERNPHQRSVYGAKSPITDLCMEQNLHQRSAYGAESPPEICVWSGIPTRDLHMEWTPHQISAYGDSLQNRLLLGILYSLDWLALQNLSKLADVGYLYFKYKNTFSVT